MAPPRFQKLVIYGVGLLGGSLGMALRRRAMAAEIVGLGRSQERLERARQLGAIDRGSTRPAEALDGADAVVLAVPPRQIRERLGEIGSLLEPGAFLTDVGSVKARIVRGSARAVPTGVLFIGSHPMAGSEKAGVEFSRGDFYEGCACIPDARRREPIRGRLNWRARSGRPSAHASSRWTPPATTGCWPAQPPAALAGLGAHAGAQPVGGRTADEVAAIAGPGLKDMTRIAAADADIWRQIFSENPAAVLAWLDEVEKILDEWRAALGKGDGKTIEALFTEGSEARRKLEMRDER